VHFCLSLFVAAVLSAPWQGLATVMWLILATGLAGILYTLIALRRARRQTNYRPVAEDWIWHAILPMVAYVVLAVASLWIGKDPARALFPVGAAALMLIFIGIHNAWDAVAYIAIQAQPKRQDS
jgi:hypothetical protein